jgi:hypothetical protein
MEVKLDSNPPQESIKAEKTKSEVQSSGEGSKTGKASSSKVYKATVIAEVQITKVDVKVEAKNMTSDSEKNRRPGRLSKHTTTNTNTGITDDGSGSWYLDHHDDSNEGGVALGRVVKTHYEEIKNSKDVKESGIT